MPELSQGLFKVMKRVDGAKFHGHLSTTAGANTKDKAPYRVLYARRPTFLIAGDVIITSAPEVVILMEHPDDHEWAVSFKAVYALEKLSWKREQFSIDPVSKVKKQQVDIDMGTLYVNFDTSELDNFEGLSGSKYRFITGQDVRVGDKVGSETVKRIVKSLGVNVAYVA